MKTKTEEQLEKEIEEKDEWIVKNANYLKKGFKKTKTFQKIIDGVIDSIISKGFEREPMELFRPLFEELYLNGCVQGVNRQRIAGLKTQLSQHKTDIKNFEKLIDKIHSKYPIQSSRASQRTVEQAIHVGVNEIKEALKEL